jgi:histone H3
VNCTQVRVLEQADKVSLSSLLEGKNSRSLEAEIALEILSDLTNETLEGELPDEEISTLLVPADLTKGDGSGPVTVGLLHATSGRGGLAGSFGGELLAGGFASGGLAGGLLGTGHFGC